MFFEDITNMESCKENVTIPKKHKKLPNIIKKVQRAFQNVKLKTKLKSNSEKSAIDNGISKVRENPQIEITDISNNFANGRRIAEYSNAKGIIVDKGCDQMIRSFDDSQHAHGRNVEVDSYLLKHTNMEIDCDDGEKSESGYSSCFTHHSSSFTQPFHNLSGFSDRRLVRSYSDVTYTRPIKVKMGTRTPKKQSYQRTIAHAEYADKLKNKDYPPIQEFRFLTFL